ncbi:Response regulator PleD [Rubripirellula reticaptiva]|uniref:diguanylate cyclase n=2 Tax=Rubripirellula reticaptiva TaxID=2528013 RepID=A0A5C6FCD9_9BACT|nr:Response regulator PleD [Rubripirellula reticaptiva]
MVAFFTVSGVAVYWVFILGVMRSFEVAQVVPDRIREALDTLSEGLLVIDERDRIVLANESFSRMVGIDQEHLIGRRPGSLAWDCSAIAGDKNYPWMRAIEHHEPQIEQLLRFKRHDGKMRFFSVNASPVSGEDRKTRGALSTFRDVTASEEYRAQREHSLAMLRTSRDEISNRNRELQILASKDALTGCLNRRAFSEAFDEIWKTMQSTGQAVSCLMIDNDHFKNVNDTFGHPVGDEVLRQVASILNDQFSPPTLVCRYGGEEFCIVMPDTSIEAAIEQAEQVRSSIEAVQLAAVPELRLTASIGVSESCYGAASPQALIAQADECLYRAKDGGRNQVIAFES